MWGSHGVVCMRQWWLWGGAFVRHKAGEGAEAKNLEHGRQGSISGAPLEMGMESDEGRWWWWWWGVVFTNARQKSGVWAKMPKPSHHGSISGAAHEMARGDDGEGWYGGVYEVVAVVGLCARQTQDERGVWAKSQN